MKEREPWKPGRWAALRDRLRTNLWVEPIAYMACAAVGALVLSASDERWKTDHSAWFAYGGHAAGARELLSTIASSMLSLAGLVFSITILVLQLASSQFSPRVLRTFLQDRVTRRAMGMFLGSFVFAMMLLPRVRSGEGDGGEEFVPAVSVYVAFLLVLVSIGLFVQYIHHMAHAIRVVNIISRVATETTESIERLYPDAVLEGEPLTPSMQPDREPDRVLVNTGSAGVIISIDEEALVHAAVSGDLVIAVVPLIGNFVPRGAPLLRVWGASQERELAVGDWIALASERTMQQDTLFGFRQLVDIAERALSPGVNDPTTAAQVLDHLHDLLRSLCTRSFPSQARVDEHGRLRLILPRPEWDDYVQLSFEEIRVYGAGSVQIVRRARAALADLLSLAAHTRHGPLLRELELLNQAASRALPGLSV